MKREYDLQLRVQSLTALHQAVVAMKSLSAHHFRTAREALGPARIYREQLEEILRSSGAHVAAGSGPMGLLVIGAELGFCGSYHSELAAEVERFRAQEGEGPTLCIGNRSAATLRRLGISPDQSYDAPTGARGAADTLLQVAGDLLAIYRSHDCRGFAVIAHQFDGVGRSHAQATAMLPITLSAQPNAPRLRYVSPQHLAGVAVRELLYITLVEQLLDALASEHGARLTATQSAEHWVDHKVKELGRLLVSARREASTQEVVEIASSARVRIKS